MAETGNLASFIADQAPRGVPPLSFIHERFTDIDAWRAEVREYLRSLLLYAPEVGHLAPELVDYVEFPDYIQQKWYITSTPGERMPIMLLVPRGLSGSAPAIVALHDHGGMYYFGKKKLLAEENEPAILTEYRQLYYGGTALANELVARGFVVAVIDSFYFGERRLVLPTPDDMQSQFLLVAEGSPQWIDLLNQISGSRESLVARALFWAGCTWPGILAWDDMRTVDFLLTRQEVDPTRIGAVGLSMGGMRAALLGAVDPRVKAVCVVGWMSTLADMLDEHVGKHAWCNFIPALTRVLDWPDVAALHAPDPLLVMQGSQDDLFPLAGFQRAAERLRNIYAKAGVPGNLDISTFDLPHCFSREMQDHAWAFFDAAFDIVREPDPESAAE
jgi:dienelactone hydrolase